MSNEETAVFEYALMQRINHNLRAGAQRLQTARSLQLEASMGHYFIVDLRRNSIQPQQIDLEELGRELGVLEDTEVVMFPTRLCCAANVSLKRNPIGGSSRSK